MLRIDSANTFPNNGRIITISGGYSNIIGYPTSDGYFEGEMFKVRLDL